MAIQILLKCWKCGKMTLHRAQNSGAYKCSICGSKRGG